MRDVVLMAGPDKGPRRRSVLELKVSKIATINSPLILAAEFETLRFLHCLERKHPSLH